MRYFFHSITINIHGGWSPKSSKARPELVGYGEKKNGLCVERKHQQQHGQSQ
ncbi:MAG: hypothetical protein NT071_01005 [Burkholderiales bacterium]|nr:hypothetical protein [Burkholderiales bacterium]